MLTVIGFYYRLTDVLKMEDWDLKKDTAEPPGPSCLSARTDNSKDVPPKFSNEPVPSDTK